MKKSKLYKIISSITKITLSVFSELGPKTAHTMNALYWVAGYSIVVH